MENSIPVDDALLDQYIAEVDLNQLSGSQPLSLPEFSDWREDDVPTDNNDVEHETEADNIGTSTIIHGNYDVLDSLVNKFAREEGFSVHRCRTKSEDKTFVQRGKFLCHKRKEEECPFAIHFAAQLHPGATLPHSYRITKRQMEHSHDLVPPVQQEKDFMKEKMSDITPEEWKFIESLIHCAPKVISRI